MVWGHYSTVYLGYGYYHSKQTICISLLTVKSCEHSFTHSRHHAITAISLPDLILDIRTFLAPEFSRSSDSLHQYTDIETQVPCLPYPCKCKRRDDLNTLF